MWARSDGTGAELVAFRMHVPTRSASTTRNGRRRGNILAWERCDRRMRGAPMTLDARMDAQSILTAR